VPIEVRRFGVGNRRPEGPAGSRRVEGQVIHGDARGAISELSFARDALLETHESPNSAWFCVIEGGGWVLVGDERQRVASGEAVVWPANVIHGAWTEHSHMRAILVELAGTDDAALRGIIEGRALVLGPGEVGAIGRGDGRLVGPAREPPPSGDREGEPL